MPREARLIPDTGYLHVISRGNNRRKVFLYDRDKRKYYGYLMQCKREDKIEICHYCIMDNHIHLIVSIDTQSDLSRFMKRLNLKYAHFYHRNYNYAGHLWQDRFKSKIISTDEYLLQCGKYIELNPVRAGKVKLPEEYKFSSYHFYAFGTKDPLITEDPLYQILGKTAEKRQIIYRQIVIDELNYNYTIQ